MARSQWGSVSEYTLTDGTTRWQARWPLPPHPVTGTRRIARASFDTEREAQHHLIRERAKLLDGIVVDPSKMTVADLLARWLEEDAAPRVKPSTLEDYQDTVRVYITGRAIGGKRAQTLAPSDVATYVAHLAKEPHRRAAELALLRLKQALKWGAAVELLTRNVADGITLPARMQQADERRALTHEEARRFLHAAKDDHYAPLWQLYLATGLRRGEGLGLRWQDVDLDRGTLSVRQQITLAGKPSRPLIQTLKSKAALRTIELDAETVRALDEHFLSRRERKGAPWFEHGLVFCTRNGLPHNPNNVLDSGKAIAVRAGLSGVGVHTLRHSHASHLLMAGVEVGIVSRRLGHSKTSVTHDVYGHVLPGYEDRVMQAIGEALYRHPALEG